ncbi:MAG: tRNA uridine-5-carboxymethylaminomethyl(34) synthesis enzyme MnmG [Clostridia bacterium]
MEYFAGQYDIIVIGAGHAGCEAALAGARLGCKTLLFTLNLDAVANMACNPSIGGTAKGHLVREIDALGGAMGKMADATTLQSKMLNRAKGPAVHSLRTQIDRRMYQQKMKQTLEEQDNLDLRQGEVIKIFTKGEKVCGVGTLTGAIYEGACIILCTGTYLKGRVIIGETSFPGGPDGLFPANHLSDDLKEKGMELMRFKTGTPARVHRKSLDLSKMEPQEGDIPIVPFSFDTEILDIPQIPCYLTYTNGETHRVIRENLARSPLFSGDIQGVGPRYCPSIEDKVVRFKEKERHQVFIEPMGKDTCEMYVQGMSSSMPEEIQEKMLKTIQGMENMKIMRPAYAIEYDCLDSLQLKPSLEMKDWEGLFSAGQINGSSGYEEAAAQGLVAGINAVQKIRGGEPVLIPRSLGYIGVLIDDLVTKGTPEPYRMMTSRSEYRLLLRQDNADQRLTPVGYEVGLIPEERYHRFLDKVAEVEKYKKLMKTRVVSPGKANEVLKKYNSPEISSGMSCEELLKRPELTYDMIMEMDESLYTENKAVREQVQISCKYEGYIKKQADLVKRHQKLEDIALDTAFDYRTIQGLRIEARLKLNKVKPASLGQASRISGVSPADINVLLIHLEQKRNRKK